jgi:tetratricopeptide (TPR) repeat protein
LASGQFVQLAFTSGEGLASLQVLTPGGAKLTTAATWQPHSGRRLTFLTESSGRYPILISEVEKGAGPSDYTLLLTEVRAANPQDAGRIAGERAFYEAGHSRLQGTAKSLRAAIPKYAEALDHFRASGARLLQAEASNACGAVHLALSEYTQALDFQQQSHALFREIGNSEGQAATLNEIGVIQMYRGQYEEARQALNESVALREASGDRAHLPSTWSNLAGVHAYLGDYDAALEYLRRARQLYRTFEDARSEASAIANEAGLLNTMGEKQQALDLLGQAQAIYRRLQNVSSQAHILSLTGEIHRSLGDYAGARSSLSEALRLQRVAGNRNGPSR